MRENVVGLKIKDTTALDQPEQKIRIAESIEGHVLRTERESKQMHQMQKM